MLLFLTFALSFFNENKNKNSTKKKKKTALNCLQKTSGEVSAV